MKKSAPEPSSTSAGEQHQAKRPKLFSPALSTTMNSSSFQNNASNTDLSAVLQDLDRLRSLTSTQPPPRTVAGFEAQLLQRQAAAPAPDAVPALTALNNLLRPQVQHQQLGALTSNNLGDVLQALMLQEQVRNCLGGGMQPQAPPPRSDLSALLALSPAPSPAESLLTSLLGAGAKSNHSNTTSSSVNSNQDLHSRMLQQLLVQQQQQQQQQQQSVQVNEAHALLALKQLVAQQHQQQAPAAPQAANVFSLISGLSQAPQPTVASTASTQHARNLTTTTTSTSATLNHSSVATLEDATVNFEGDRLVPLAMSAEQWVMSEYQCLLRQQIAFVESSVTARNNDGKTQGRNKPIVPGQVGILCKHCARLPAQDRPRGAIYYPAKLHRVYQAAQNMAHNHFAASCRTIPEPVRQRLLKLKEQKAVTVGAGKEYWHSAAMNVGVREGEDGLYLSKELPATNQSSAVAKKKEEES